jgi:hypothetical protein
MIFNMTGGGGSQLNFKVVAYATEELLTADTPKENTIGIVTTTPIPSWYFAAEQPDNMAEGEVWFWSDNGSNISFNALKKNNIKVSPIAAKQYISGALTDVPAKIYRDGEWNDFSTDFWIFKAGSGAMVEYLTKKGSAASIVVDDYKVSISYSGDTSLSDAVWYTAAKHDLTKYKKLKLSAMLTAFTSGQHYVGFGVKSSVPTKDNYGAQSFVAGKEIRTKGTTPIEYELDISALTGEYYIVFCGAVCTVEFTDFRAVM